MPDRRLELHHARGHAGAVCGIDEAGRGPLAGPVVAAAVILPPVGESGAEPDWVQGLDDSKILTAARRTQLDAAIRAGATVGVGLAEVAEIDRLNILQATYLAMRRAVAALPAVPGLALVDGKGCPPLPCPAVAVVDGDALCPSIAAASIVAKVHRDAIMARLAAAFPGYGWERNAGYGTAAHLEAIRRLGPTPHHRLSFAPLKQGVLEV